MNTNSAGSNRTWLSHPGAGFIIVQDSGYLELAGDDRVTFIQRQSTNDLTNLANGRCVRTVLTDPTARILDVLSTFHTQDNLGMLTLAGQAYQTASYLQSHIFFMDKVSVSDFSSELSQVELHGPEAPSILAALGFAQVPQLDEIMTHGQWRVLGQMGLGLPGFRLLVPSGEVEELTHALETAGAERLSPDTYQVLRIEAGLPAPGAELTQDYSPLEVGMAGIISSSKGCYTGQEVLARQITYDKVSRQLVGIFLSAPVETGVRLSSSGKPAGKLTSSAISPTFGPIALGVVRRPFNEPGTTLQVKAGDGIDGVTTSLPFRV